MPTNRPSPKKRAEDKADRPGEGSPPKKKKGLHVKTPDGKAICFKYNNNEKCANAKCTFVHVCQKCLGHPKSQCAKLKGDTRRGEE